CLPGLRPSSVCLRDGQPAGRAALRPVGAGVGAVTGVALTEAQFQRQVVDLARLRGWWVFHDHDSRRNPAGLPDLLLLRDRLVVAELKTTSGRVRAAQAEV